MKTIIQIIIVAAIANNMNGQINMTKLTPLSDKELHVYAGTAINIGVSTVVYSKTKKTGLACASGFVAGVLVGMLKEVVYDKALDMGHPERADFSATVWGSVIGFPIVRVGIDLHERKMKHKEYFENLNSK